jgi:hypothetical protein
MKNHVTIAQVSRADGVVPEAGGPAGPERRQRRRASSAATYAPLNTKTIAE